MNINKNKLIITNGPELVTEFYKSGLKPREFCAQKNITYHKLQYWRKLSKTKNKANQLINPKFLPINVVQPILKSAFIKIIINSKITVEFPTEVDELQFKKVLEVCMTCG